MVLLAMISQIMHFYFTAGIFIRQLLLTTSVQVLLQLSKFTDVAFAEKTIVF